MVNAADFIGKLGGDFAGSLKLSEDGQAVYVAKEQIVSLAKKLKVNYGFALLLDITAAEYDDRLEVVYHLMNLADAGVLRVKASLGKDTLVVPSVMGVWKAANVLEREIYDMMGIHFEGHNELKRILCPDDFSGHPLRKDFKLVTPSRFKE